ncbi:MAG: hypothetical protein JWO12_2633 [Frankiales bacterium]|nr:hypothetical protein [Frankiales bacterium]
MRLDLHHRPTLLKSWLATLHAPELTVSPRLVGPLPGWGQLVRSALAWHLVYALVAYAGALFVSRSDATSGIALILHDGGLPAVLLATVIIWWLGVGLSTALWWAGVQRARNRG